MVQPQVTVNLPTTINLMYIILMHQGLFPRRVCTLSSSQTELTATASWHKTSGFVFLWLWHCLLSPWHTQYRWTCGGGGAMSQTELKYREHLVEDPCERGSGLQCELSQQCCATPVFPLCSQGLTSVHVYT